MEEFSQEDYDAIVNSWTEKLQRCEAGDQRWGLFHATKDWEKYREQVQKEKENHHDMMKTLFQMPEVQNMYKI